MSPEATKSLLRRIIHGAAIDALHKRPFVKRLHKAGTSEFAAALSTADLEIQLSIINHLANHFPKVPVLGEEATPGSSLSISEQQRNYFVVDPIDGSYFYLGNAKNYGVMAALVSNGKYIAASAALPEYDIDLSFPPFQIEGHASDDFKRVAFCSPETTSRAQEELKRNGYTLEFACGLLCMIAPLVWKHCLGVYPRNLSIPR